MIDDRYFENYTLIVKGSPVSVLIRPNKDHYVVSVDNRDIGTMVRNKDKQFACEHTETKRVFVGRSRSKAATSMICSILKRN